MSHHPWSCGVSALPGIQSSARLTCAVRGLLDFFYLSQYPIQTTESLDALDMALRQFHEEKEVFIELGVQEHFNLPKLHSLAHYWRSITLFGSTNNYNTEQSEWLHIDFTKNAYRATNFKDKYKQMTTWLEQQEAMHQHNGLIELRKGISAPPVQCPAHYSTLPSVLYPFLTMHPSEKGVTFENLSNRYGAVDFQDALADFIVQHNYPELSASASWRRADNTLIPFQRVSVFHKIKFAHHDDPDKRTIDVIHIQPEGHDRHGLVNPRQFDMGLVKNGTRIQVVQIWVVFQLSTSAVSMVFLASRPAPPAQLAYVEWFSPPSAPGTSHNMCRVSRHYRNGRRSASVVPLTDICRSVQLFPVFGPIAPRQWKGSTVLEECNNFYVNPFLDRHMYQNFSGFPDEQVWAESGTEKPKLKWGITEGNLRERTINVQHLKQHPFTAVKHHCVILEFPCAVRLAWALGPKLSVFGVFSLVFLSWILTALHFAIVPTFLPCHRPPSPHIAMDADTNHLANGS
ncbi:hypothetical protein EDB83DRAFT_2648142 [Lactarius deliciosus]|nr:hypothetical protein EDB83DRAFT_2648142 [Lactarius deliciosus]